MRLGELRNLSQKYIGTTLAAIAANTEERLLVALGAGGSASVADEGYEIAEIAGVAYCAFDALVGQ